jgi:hypothetical protein
MMRMAKTNQSSFEVMGGISDEQGDKSGRGKMTQCGDTVNEW